MSVFAGTKEGSIKTENMQGRKAHILTLTDHFSSLMTFALEAVAKKAPNVSFVHSYHGFVKTKLGYDVQGTMLDIARGIYDIIFPVVGMLLATSVDDAGERQIFLATSFKFPGAGEMTSSGVSRPKGLAIAKGTNEKSESGVYSVTNGGEVAAAKTVQLLAQMRQQGLDKKVWSNIEEEFFRITGVASV